MTTPNNFPLELEIAGRIPWGYVRNEDKPLFCIPNYSELEILSGALDLLEGGHSYRQVLDYLSGLDRKMSIKTLKSLFEKHRPESPIHSMRREEKSQIQKTIRKNIIKKPKILSNEEKELRKKSQKIKGEKVRITQALKRLERLEGEKETTKEIIKEVKETLKTPVVAPNLLSDNQIEQITKDREVIFKPHSGPQEDFLSAPELEVLYGGSAGSGKSYALIADPMRYFENKNFVGLLIRKTNDELRELIWKTKELYPKVFKDAKFHERDSEWRFPSGGRLWMSYLDRDDDVLRYQGQSYTWIGFDELTHWATPFAWNYLRSRLRSAEGSGLENSLSMRATTNPGNLGHAWVKKMFIDPAPPGKPFWAQNPDTGEILIHPSTKQPLFKRRFIPAKLKDNPSLYNDGVYERNLLSLPESKRRQLLEGDWTIADGAAFPEFRTSIHTVEPFEIPSSWKRFRACDYGYSSYSCVLWFAIDPSDEQLVVYRELYGSKLTPEALADKVVKTERNERVVYGVLDSSVWHKRGEGPTPAEVMINRGCKWRPSDRSQGSREAGAVRLHELLKQNEFTERPGIIFFDTCRQVISDLQVIPSDPDGSDDIDKRFKSDHSYDALRYGIMSRPKAGPWWEIDRNGGLAYVRPSDTVFGY